MSNLPASNKSTFKVKLNKHLGSYPFRNYWRQINYLFKQLSWLKAQTEFFVHSAVDEKNQQMINALRHYRYNAEKYIYVTSLQIN